MNIKFTIHKIVLSVIPHSVIYFFRKRISLNYLFFGRARKGIGQYILNNSDSRFSLYGMEKELGDEVTKGFLSVYTDYHSRGFLRKYILQVNDCIIEPASGWVSLKKAAYLYLILSPIMHGGKLITHRILIIKQIKQGQHITKR